jgi:Flp pilus assembly protein TadD
MRRNERERLQAFARGEATWAEVEGITAADAARMGRTGVELAQAGRLREAALVFEAMVEINPRDAGAHAALGTVYQKLGRSEEAVNAYGEALARDPDHPVALGNRGELLLRLGRREGYADVAAAVAADPEGRTAAGRRAARLAKAITADAMTRLGIQ